MWSPTHVEITVSRARNLKAKGKSGTNDAYVTIKHGEEKFQTTLRERTKEPEWHEQCQFPLSDEHSMVKLKVYHRNLIGKDDFLGYTEIKLDATQVYERPRSKWYDLGNKPDDKGPPKHRGEIEVFVTYVVESVAGSHMSLNNTGKSKKKMSIKGLAHQFDKFSLKGTLKRNRGQAADSSGDLRDVESEHKQLQGFSTLPRGKGATASVLEEESETHSDDQDTSKNDKPAATQKSSGFKFPFRPKNKHLQKMSLLSRSTLGLPTAKGSGSKSSQMREVLRPPSETSSGFGSRRVSASESLASSCDSSAPAKDLDEDSSKTKQGSAEDILEQRESAEAEPLNLEPSQTGSGRALDEELAAAENVEIDARQNEENISNAPENQMPSESVGLDKPPESEVPADEFSPMTPESVDVAIDKSKTDDYDDKTEQISRQSESITSAALSESSHSGALASDRLESADSDRSCLLPEPADLHSKPSEPPPSVVPDTSTVELKQSATTVESDDFLFHDSHPQRTASNSESATLDAKLDDSSSDFANLKLELLDAKSQSEEPKHESEDRAESVPSPESTVRSKEAASQKEQVLSGKTLDDSQLPSQTSAKVSSESVGTTAKVLKRSNTEVIPAVEKAELQKTGSSENLSCSSSHTSSEAPTRPSLLLPKETLQQFQHYTRDDLILLVLDQQRLLKERDAHIHDLENYIDNLLVKIINTQPRILSTNDSQPAKHSAVSPSNSGKLRSP